MELDKDTKLDLLQKSTLWKINDVLDENYPFGSILFIDDFVRHPDAKWKQYRIDKAIELLDAYKERRTRIINDLE